MKKAFLAILILSIQLSSAGYASSCSIEFLQEDRQEVIKLYQERYRLIQEKAPRPLIVKLENDIKALEEKLKKQGIEVTKQEIANGLNQSQKSAKQETIKQAEIRQQESVVFDKNRPLNFNKPEKLGGELGLVHKTWNHVKDADLVFVLPASSEKLNLVWLTQGRMIRTIKELDDAQIWSAAQSPDGQLLALGHNTGEVVLLDMQNSVVKGHWKAHQNGIEALAFDGDSRLILAAKDRKLEAWDLNSKQKLPMDFSSSGFFGNHHAQGMRGVKVDSARNLVFGYGLDGALSVWNKQTGELIKTTKVTKESAILEVELIPNSTKAVVSILQGGAAIVDWKSGAVLKVLGQGPGFFRGLAVAENGDQIFYGFRESISMYSLSQNTTVEVFRFKGEDVSSIQLTHDKRSLLTFTDHGNLWLFKE